MNHPIVRSFLCLTFAFVVCAFAPYRAHAQTPDAGTDAGTPDGASAVTSPFGRCATLCSALIDGLPEDLETPSEESDLAIQQRNIEMCATQIPECGDLTDEDRAALPSLCDSLRRGGHHAVAPAEERRAPPPAFCVMPEGTTRDEASRHCRCPATAPYAFQVSRHRSARLPIEHLRTGDLVFVCMDPYAVHGAPGSSDERLAAMERTLTEADAALRRLCEPHEGEALSTACARAREDFLNLGSAAGPVDLDPIMHAIEGLQANAEEQQHVIDRMIEEDHSRDVILDQHHHEIEALSRSMSALEECFAYGRSHTFEVQSTDGTPDGLVTTTVSCETLMMHASEPLLRQAREAAERAAREAISHISVDGGHAFAWLQAYGLVGFNPLTYGNVSYGNIWQIGGELTIGVGLGSGWNFHGGLGIAYGGPNIQGATNVAGEMRIGVGTFVIPELMIGFGFMATHRFLPDVFSADSIYGAYLDGTIRFSPNSEWSPVLTLRVAGGASPRQAGRGWDVQPNGLAQILFGVAHF